MHAVTRLAVVSASLLCLRPAAAADPDAVARLHELFDEHWERELAEDPILASNLGDRRYDDRWPDSSLEAIERSHAADRRALESLEDIPRESLPAEEQLNYELFGREYGDRVAGHRFRQFLLPINQRGGVQTAHELAERLPFRTARDYRNWIARLASLDRYVDQTIALMRRGIEEKRVHPRVIMTRVPAQIDAQIVADPTDSPYYAPFEDLPADIGDEERAALEQAARTAIRESVLPAYRRLADFFTGQYLPATPEAVGAWMQPDGGALYRFRVKLFTTRDLSPDEVHETGLAEVERIRGEMQAIIDELGFEGSFDEFLEFLRSDPQFYYGDPEELFEAYLATAKRVDPMLVKLFGRLPRMPYGVRPIPAESAPDTTTAYYSRPAADGSRAGYYYVNLYKPEVRPKYEIEVLTVHEAVPGHHLQLALAQELGELPAFRRYGGFTAFTEGWALYSESLGDELGLYDDPYSKFGQLTYEMWRAVRLVVDTGMHHKRWTREQAIDFFKANAAKTEHDIVNEIDRYIAWPGQALAYKIGELEIKALRAEAEAALGGDFDIRAFHDTVLESGGVPLDILRANIEAWIRTVGRDSTRQESAE
ncbi:MAG TPA: DUF885 domain-containing protein [Gammaproteobacteria bacterium]|nr:DUF885 domain-containing protein [Gammaproteobacteria bacterium]